MHFILLWHSHCQFSFRIIARRLALVTVFLIFVLQYSFAQSSLTQVVSIKTDGQTIQSVLTLLKEKTGVSFLYSSLPGLSTKISVDEKLQPLGQVLDKILLKHGMTYEMRGNKVLIFSTRNAPVQKKVRGKVRDEKGLPLPGVHVQVKNSTNGIATDTDGNFSLSVNEDGAILAFSFIGFLPQEILVGGKQVIDIQLQPDSKGLQEVVVTALGIQREEKSLGYSTTKVKGEQLTAALSNNWTDALSGKVAGLNLVRSNGGPTGSNSIILRGESNITGSNDALIVIDGVVINNGSGRTTGTGYRSQADADSPTDYGSTINDINPEDIASVSVLKGPSAAALYGQRGANGALIITTKTGTPKIHGIGVTFNSNTAIETAMRFPDYQYEYGQGDGNAKYYSYNASADGAATKGTSSAWGPKFNGQQYFQYDPVTQAGGTVRTSWVGYPGTIQSFFNTGKTVTNTIALDGGNEKTQVRFSATRVDNTWIIPNTGYGRNTAVISASHKVSEKLKISTNISYTDKFSDNLPAVGYNNQTVMYWTNFMEPNAPLSWIKDYWKKGQEGVLQNYPFSSNPDNPYLIAYEMLNKSDRNSITGNITANYDFNKSLSLMVRTTLDLAYESRSQQKPYDTEKFKEGMYRTQSIFSQEKTSDFLLRYNKKIGSLWEATFSAGGSTLSNTYRMDDLRADALLYPEVYNLANSKNTIVAIPYRSQYKINSLYGLASFSYHNFLFLDVTGRNDWNSVLATAASTDNVSFFYPSFSLSAVISDMVKLPSVVSFAKLRASYAGVGSGRNVPYQTSVGYVSQPLFPGGLANPTTLANLDLKPLYTTSIELGADIRFFRNRMGVDVAVYKSNTRDQILSAGLDRSTGASLAIVNAGEVQNKGIEIQLNGKPVQDANGFNWNIFGTFSANNSKVLSMTQDLPELQLQTGPQGASATVAKVGASIDALYGIGYQRAPDGQVIYENGYPLKTTEMVYLGNVTPAWKASIGNEFTYKRAHFSFLFDSQHGAVAFSMTHASNMTQGKTTESLPGRDGGLIGKGVIRNPNGTFRPNDVEPKDISLYYQGHAARENAEGNTFSTDFIKLREATFSYDLSPQLTKRLGLQRVTVGVYGRNLLIFSKWPQFDPEFGTLNGGNIDKGLEAGQFPATRTFGLNLTIGL